MNSAQPASLPSVARRRQFLFFKIAGIGLLIALLHLPLSMMHGVLRERQTYQSQATEEIGRVWGRHQLVTGLVLAVPYVYKTPTTRSRMLNGRTQEVEELQWVSATAYFLPDTLDVKGTIEPEVRHRGIYDTVVYSTTLKLAGSIRPDFAAAGIDAERIDWDKAHLLLGASDLHGVRSVRMVAADGKTSAVFESAEGFLPLAVRATGVERGKWEFAVELALQGSERLEIAPIGKVTTATLESTWPDPSFMGASLPVMRRVGNKGFGAEWKTSHFGHGFPQSWTDRYTENAKMARKIGAESFGVKFARPVDGYSMAERAQKYGVLFFVLVFTVFFLFEITAALKIHPLQYALVGAALCLFFIGFLALSEFWGVGWAYFVAAMACTLMISLYAWSFLKTGWRTRVIGGGLALTYGYLYFVLKSQDYALVAGTAALFVALALVMFCTRRINWYALDLEDARGIREHNP